MPRYARINQPSVRQTGSVTENADVAWILMMTPGIPGLAFECPRPGKPALLDGWSFVQRRPRTALSLSWAIIASPFGRNIADFFIPSRVGCARGRLIQSGGLEFVVSQVLKSETWATHLTYGNLRHPPSGRGPEIKNFTATHFSYKMAGITKYLLSGSDFHAQISVRSFWSQD